MKWLLLALSLVLISPLSAASWDPGASLHQVTDNAVVMGIDCFELTSADTDTDNDDTSTYNGLPLTARHESEVCLGVAPHGVSQSRINHAIRAPPQF